MSAALVLGRLALAVVFAVSAVGKLADRRGARQSLEDFGIPSRFAGSLALWLPLAELGVAISLVPPATAAAGALAASVLLIVFVGAISANLVRRRHPDCHCFGQLHSAPAGWKMLVRNLGLAGLAGFVAWRAWEDPGSGAFSASEEGGLLVAAALASVGCLGGWFALRFLEQHERLRSPLSARDARGGGGLSQSARGDTSVPPSQARAGLQVGVRAPKFVLSSSHGERLTLTSLLRPRRPLVLIFTDPQCGPCDALFPTIARWQRDHADRLTVAVLSRGKLDAIQGKVDQHGLVQVGVDGDGETAIAYEAHATPSALIVRPDGHVETGLAPGSAAINGLVAHALSDDSYPVSDFGYPGAGGFPGVGSPGDGFPRPRPDGGILPRPDGGILPRPDGGILPYPAGDCIKQMQSAGATVRNDPANVVSDTCLELERWIKTVGVYCANGEAEPGWAGCVLFNPTAPPVTRSGDPYYDGTGRWCGVYTTRWSAPLAVDMLRWSPPTASAECWKELVRWQQELCAHELGHLHDIHTILAKANADWRRKEICVWGPERRTKENLDRLATESALRDKKQMISAFDRRDREGNRIPVNCVPCGGCDVPDPLPDTQQCCQSDWFGYRRCWKGQQCCGDACCNGRCDEPFVSRTGAGRCVPH